MSFKKDERAIPLKEIVSEYDNSLFFVRNYFFDRIKYSIEFAEIKDSDNILDAGCGIGYLLREIRKKNERCKLTGIDFNINVRNIKIPDCDIRISDVNNLQFKNNSFDIVIALDLLEHIKNVNIAIKEIKRVLKPGAKFIITGPTESLFYKICRFLLKGTFSEKKGPGSGIHHHNIFSLDKKIIRNNFQRRRSLNLPRFFSFALVKVIEYQNNK